MLFYLLNLLPGQPFGYRARIHPKRLPQKCRLACFARAGPVSVVQVTGNASLTEKRMMRKITAALSRKEKKTLVLLTLADAVISIADIAFLGLLVFVIHVYTDRPVAPSRLSVLLPGLANAGSLLPAVYFFLFYCLKNALGILLSRAQYRFLLQVSSRIYAQRLVH
jgi:hypothetical protein